MKDLNCAWLRQHIGIVSQEPSLFSCSIADNIAYGATNPETVTSNQIITAAKKANAYNFIQYFPHGFDTLVGERGIMLSGRNKGLSGGNKSVSGRMKGVSGTKGCQVGTKGRQI